MNLFDSDHIIRRSSHLALLTIVLLTLAQIGAQYIAENDYKIRNALVNEEKVIGDYEIEVRNGKKHIKYLYGESDKVKAKRELKKKDAQKEKEMPASIKTKYFLINFSQQFIATFILYLLFFLILFKWKNRVAKKVTLLLLVSFVWIILYSLIMVYLMLHANVVSLDRVISIRFTIAMVVLAASLLNFYITKDHEQALENEKLQSLYLSTKYEALKSKLDPHFLFNALNTLNGLIALKSDNTKTYIQKLSTIFRNVLTHNDVTTLEDELKFASAYGDLMTIRYETSLKIDYDIPEGLLNSKVVSFGIQTLLENAIKHNTITTRLPMHITVKSEEDYITVSNPIHPRHETETSSGLGLKLLSERCLAQLNRNIIIDNQQNTFTVKLPIQFI